MTETTGIVMPEEAPPAGERPEVLRIREKYRAFDAEHRFGLTYQAVPDNKACECGAILRGVKKPTDCKVFGTVCTPENPLGSCMVSSEGACAAHYTYGRFRDAQPTTPCAASCRLRAYSSNDANLRRGGKRSGTTR